MNEAKERFQGCLLGLAVGDALGTSVEFCSPGTFTPITDMVGGGVFQLNPGEWTDDTSMALCLASSLIEQGGFDPIDQLQRYTRWKHEGYMSSNGRCFDIGNTVNQALNQFSVSNEAYPGSEDEWSAGNGSLMRLAPIPMYYWKNPVDTIQYAAMSSRTTHGNIKAIDACRYCSGLIVGALNGEDKETLLRERYCPIESYWEKNSLEESIDEVASGSFKRKHPPEIKGSGYVVKSMEAALWAFHNNDSFKDGCLLAVNLGDDADTTAAIYGQLAGAFYGVESIPKEWLDILAKRELIESLAKNLFETAKKQARN